MAILFEGPSSSQVGRKRFIVGSFLLPLPRLSVGSFYSAKPPSQRGGCSFDGLTSFYFASQTSIPQPQLLNLNFSDSTSQTPNPHCKPNILTHSNTSQPFKAVKGLSTACLCSFETFPALPPLATVLLPNIQTCTSNQSATNLQDIWRCQSRWYERNYTTAPLDKPIHVLYRFPAAVKSSLLLLNSIS